MAQIRMQVEIDRADDLPADIIVNTVFFDTDVGTDVENLADDLVEAWTEGINGLRIASGYRCRVKAYLNPGAGPTGAPDYVTDYVNFPGAGAGGPREVALCLSYFAGTNTPRRRGRIYVGPFSAGDMTERPSGTLRSALAGLAERLSGLGGVNVQWVQYSRTNGTFTNVSNYWVDDEWDTVRSRGLEATTRTTGTVNG